MSEKNTYFTADGVRVKDGDTVYVVTSISDLDTSKQISSRIVEVELNEETRKIHKGRFFYYYDGCEESTKMNNKVFSFRDIEKALLHSNVFGTFDQTVFIEHLKKQL